MNASRPWKKCWSRRVPRGFDVPCPQLPPTKCKAIASRLEACIGTARESTEAEGQQVAGPGFELWGFELRGRSRALVWRGQGDRRSAGARVAQVHAGKAARGVWSAGACMPRGVDRGMGTLPGEACKCVCVARIGALGVLCWRWAWGHGERGQHSHHIHVVFTTSIC